MLAKNLSSNLFHKMRVLTKTKLVFNWQSNREKSPKSSWWMGNHHFYSIQTYQIATIDT